MDSQATAWQSLTSGSIPPKASDRNHKHVIPAEAGIINPRPSSVLASPTTILPSHFSVGPANMCTRAVQGCRRYARTCRWSSIPATSRSLATFSGGGSWAERCLQTAHRRIGFPNAMHRVWGPFPMEGVRFGASPSRFRPSPLVPGLFWFRARVILLPDAPTRPTQRLPAPGTVPPFPHPEPPLLLVLLGLAPCPGPDRGLHPSNPSCARPAGGPMAETDLCECGTRYPVRTEISKVRLCSKPPSGA
jgi:hypothetical protein